MGKLKIIVTIIAENSKLKDPVGSKQQKNITSFEKLNNDVH